MHTSACPFFELILHVRDMSSGTFLVVPGIVTMPFVLAFLGIRVLACSFKIVCQCLQYYGLKHGPEIWVITLWWSFSAGGPGLDLKHSSFALCGPFSSFSTSEYLSCGMKHAAPTKFIRISWKQRKRLLHINEELWYLLHSC